jgi:hypothetical protein
MLPQQSEASAQLVPSAPHGGGGPPGRQRFGPTIGGSRRHFSPPQQSPSAPQISPSFPHAGAGGWHRFTPVASAPQTFEQQSSFVAQTSHTGRQPPIAAHRFAPSPVATHWREQHSVASLHTSPICFVHAFLSVIVHAAVGEQRKTPLGSASQRPEQQESGPSHVSPSTRHAWRSAHVFVPSPRSVQSVPQQSTSSAHVSPAGLQPVPALAHVFPAHSFEQQSVARAHAAPAAAQLVCSHVAG